jgi:hypothetical protein
VQNADGIFESRQSYEKPAPVVIEKYQVVEDDNPGYGKGLIDLLLKLLNVIKSLS